MIFLQNKKNLDILPSLNASGFFLEHRWMFEPFLIVVWVPQSSSVWEDGSQNHTVTAGKGSNMQKMLENWRFLGHGGLFWRTVLSLTVLNKQETHEQPSENSHGSSRKPHTVLKTKGSQTFEWIVELSYYGHILKDSAQIMDKKMYLAMREKKQKQDSIFLYFYDNYAYQTRMKMQTSWYSQ